LLDELCERIGEVALIICLLAGAFFGVIFGGRTALRYARRHELENATRSLHAGALAAGGVAMISTTLLLGWPMKESTVAVPVEVIRTVVETIQVPVEVTKWFFFTSTTTKKQEVPKEITETVMRSHKVNEFSIWLLIPMLLVGFLGSWVYRWVVRMAWRWFW